MAAVHCPALSEDAKVNLEELRAGLEFGPYEMVFTSEKSDAYLSATGADLVPHDFGTGLHPLQLDAYVLSQLIAELEIIPKQIETVHAGQQMTVHRAVRPGELISAKSILKSCSNRRGSIWAIFETGYRDENDALVAESSSTIIMIP